MRKAFLLGAGLGTRLQPLTETLPKPLIPFANRPLITHALDHCLQAGITDFAINTHHLHETWDRFFPNGKYRDANLTFFHEPELLETGGGIKNIADWIKDDPVLVYNGDIITDFPIDRLMTGHMASNNTATLAVQNHGPDLRITVDGHRVTDVRGLIHQQQGTHQFTGIYVIDPEILELIPPNEKISIIPAFVELIKQGELGAYHVKGHPKWLDLGTRETYLKASLAIPPKVSREARISETANIQNSWVAQNAIVESGSIIKDSILWPDTHVLQDAELTNCIVHSNSPTSGVHKSADL
ncbi:sugar phosphate nucleotidyltransferase [bacterium]|jgi:mannose-1-phosphate guanylyltransferase|nr:sugar phosphate nucleotidyltransferase [Akkermansiaceae bacterium]MDA7515913.1 sugar phosphate nucleotidyltransferase [Akkermansiaceae bacterium]MDA7530658.1 sugar phosphate nucleotidyltransferase [bacterium]